MSRYTEITPGQRFRDARVTAFGARSRAVWVVDRVWHHSDGIEYVHLVQEDNPGEVKMIARATLADRRLFGPAADER
jgi:hypothetical protein